MLQQILEQIGICLSALFLCWNEIAKKIDIDKNVRKYDNIENKRHKSDGKAIL